MGVCLESLPCAGRIGKYMTVIRAENQVVRILTEPSAAVTSSLNASVASKNAEVFFKSPGI